MKIQITKLRNDVMLPEYQTEHAAACDLHAAIDEPLVLKAHKYVAIPSGVAIALPVGYEAQIRGRSGLAMKHGISVVHGVGTIDADYRGELIVLLINHGDEDFIVEPNTRIAQMVIAKCEQVEWSEVEPLDETARSAGGFGSTGK